MSKIFVSIACFMDPDVINTIDDCFEKAKHPKNITIGVCLQHDPQDYFFEKYENHPQVKLIKMHYSEAKGPAYARYKLYKLFSNEDFFFQIDCHSRFFDNWDEKVLGCYNECLKINQKAIISYYPENIVRMKNNSQSIVNISTVRCVDKRMGIKTHGRWVSLKNCPKNSWGVSAAMLFFNKEAYNDIVFDDEIYFGLQFEEQVVLAARYWTNGYDIFTPSKHIIATEYITNRKRQKKTLFRNSREQNETYNKLCHIMKLNYNKKYENCEKSKLGNVRTIEDYYKMLKIFDKVKNTFINHFLEDSDINKNLKYTSPLLDSNGKIKTIYINLEKSKNKNKKMKENLDKFDFCNYRRFNAIVGKDVYKNLLLENKIYKYTEKRGIYVNNHMVGCWQSHLKIWEEMINKNISFQLIMEDDCVFHDKFKEKFNEVLSLIKNKDFDILYIGYSGANPVFNKNLHLINNGCPRTTHSYILSLSGAKKLVNKISKINYPVDEIMGRLMNKKIIKGYRTSELLVWQPWQWSRPRYKKRYFNI